jgi:hypothetical protein
MNFLDNVKVYQNGSKGTASATAATYIDTKGFQRANILVGASPNSNATTSAAWATISVRESDTATNPTEVVVAASYATAISTSVAANLLPTTYAVSGGTIQISLDLAKRKRYLGVYTVKAGDYGTCAGESIAVILSKGKESADTTTEKQTVNYGASTVAPSYNSVVV